MRSERALLNNDGPFVIVFTFMSANGDLDHVDVEKGVWRLINGFHYTVILEIAANGRRDARSASGPKNTVNIKYLN